MYAKFFPSFKAAKLKIEAVTMCVDKSTENNTLLANVKIIILFPNIWVHWNDRFSN